MKTTINIADDKKTLIIERRFSAVRSKVWAAFTQADIFIKWYGPEGWSTKIEEFNFVIGGRTVYGMTCDDESQGEWFGHTEWGKFVYTDIDAQNTYRFTNHFVDEHGQDQAGMPISETTMQFIEDEGATNVIGTDVYESPEALQQVLEMGATEGIKETWDHLATLLE